MNKRILKILTCALIVSSFTAYGVQATTDKNINKSSDIATMLEKGGTIPAGKYTLNRGVTISKPIIANNVVIDASACPNDTIAITAHASITGITVNNAKRQGISVQSCSGVIIKDCTVTNAQFAGIEVKNNASNITFDHCESDNNYDPAHSGENADGFGIKNGAKNITLKNCTAKGNSDDGYDTYTAGDNITFIGCVAESNGYNKGSNGDGNGFKLGPNLYGSQNGGLIKVQDCKAINNKGVGFLRNHNKVAPIFSGKNIATGNAKGDFKLDYTPLQK